MTIQIDPEGTETHLLRRHGEFTGASDRRVLEIGCGDGRLTWRYANQAGRVTGIDLHSDDLRIALVDRPANLEQRVQFTRSDALHLPFAHDSFDLAIFSWSF